VRALPRRARPLLPAPQVPPAQEGALPLGAGTCPCATFGGLPDLPRLKRPHSHHHSRDCQQPGSPASPESCKDPRKLTVFLLRARHGGVTSRDPACGEVRLRARRSAPRLRPQRAAGETLCPGVPPPCGLSAQAQTAAVGACRWALQAGTPKLSSKPVAGRRGSIEVDKRNPLPGTQETSCHLGLGEGGRV
jgi:hypothetical protein